MCWLVSRFLTADSRFNFRTNNVTLLMGEVALGRSQWPRGLMFGSATAIVDENPAGAWLSVSCECCVLSRRGLSVGLITSPEESYRVWCVWVWSWSFDNEEAVAHWRLLCHGKKLPWIISKKVRFSLPVIIPS